MSEWTEIDDAYWDRIERENQQRYHYIVAMLQEGRLTMATLREDQRDLLRKYGMPIKSIPGGKSDGSN